MREWEVIEDIIQRKPHFMDYGLVWFGGMFAGLTIHIFLKKQVANYNGDKRKRQQYNQV